MAHEIDPARTGLLVSVVLCFFFVYIVGILQWGRGVNKYSKFEESDAQAYPGGADGEAMEMKKTVELFRYA